MYADRTKRLICAAAATTFVTGALIFTGTNPVRAEELSSGTTTLAASSDESSSVAEAPAPVALTSTSDPASTETIPEASSEYETTLTAEEMDSNSTEDTIENETAAAVDKALDELSDDKNQTMPKVTMDGDLSINGDTTNTQPAQLVEDQSVSVKATLDTKPIYDQTETVYKDFGFSDDSFKDLIKISNLQSEFYATFALGEGLTWDDTVTVTYSGGNGLYKLTETGRDYNVLFAHFVLNKEKADQIKTYRDLQNAVKDEGLLQLVINGIKSADVTGDIKTIKGTLNGAFKGNASLFSATLPFHFRWSGVQSDAGRDYTLSESEDKTTILASYTVAAAPEKPEEPAPTEQPEVTPEKEDVKAPEKTEETKPETPEVKVTKASATVLPKTSDTANPGLVAILASLGLSLLIPAARLRKSKK